MNVELEPKRKTSVFEAEMLMKILLICNLEVGIGLREELLAVMNLKPGLQAYYFFYFWKNQPQVDAGLS